jgi:homoserine kinase
MKQRLRIFAPATIANLGPGFDVLGLALSAPGDVVEAELSDRPGVEIVEITGDNGALSKDPVRNVAGRAAADVLRRAAHPRGMRLWLHKQMPLASGLGSSGASSAAGAVAANELLGRPLHQRDLLLSAMEGERAASGTPHADNVAPSVLGGIVLVRSYDPFEVLSLPVPPELRVVVVHPHCKVSTAEARTLVKNRGYSLDHIVPNLGNIAALVLALCRSDLALLGRSIDDRLIEPLRATLIPGFVAVKDAALSAGALGCSIAGSGPSVFAFASDDETAARIGAAMQSAFKSAAKLESDLYSGKVNPIGARAIND